MKTATIEELEVAVREAKGAVNAAEAELEYRKGKLNEARAEVRRAETSTRDLEIGTAEDVEFAAKSPTGNVRPYILPFGREHGKWNPRDVENAAFGKSWLSGMYAIICLRTDQARSRPSRLIFSHGNPLREEQDKIGNYFMAKHDQTGAFLGEYRIVGIVAWNADGDVLRVVGDVPDVKYSQNTYK